MLASTIAALDDFRMRLLKWKDLKSHGKYEYQTILLGTLGGSGAAI